MKPRHPFQRDPRVLSRLMHGAGLIQLSDRSRLPGLTNYGCLDASEGENR